MIKTMTVNAMIRYIEDNIKEKKIDINKLVIHSGYSRSYLQLIFKKKTGITLGKYIQLQRVNRAASLLRLTNLSLLTISELVHYDSQQTFSREFKKNTGYTPMQYRKYCVWYFINTTNHIGTSKIRPVPDILYMEEKKIHGVKFSYEEKSCYFTSCSDLKWSIVDSLFKNGESCVTVSHRLKTNQEKTKNLTVDAILWSDEKTSNISTILKKHTYAVFSFKGNKEEYYKFIHYIYMLILPFYGFNRDEGYDFEKINKAIDGEFIFSYNIPIKMIWQ